jgi:flagellar biosynthesis/type III secretory pathway chaperone
MKNVDQLVNVLKAEADLAEALLGVVEEKQKALVHFKADEVARAVERERKLLIPMQELERERTEIIDSLASNVSGLPKEQGRHITVSELAAHIESEGSRKLKTLAVRLRATARRIQHRNQQNHVLLESSARFVKNTLRILTEDYSRQLVDEKI